MRSSEYWDSIADVYDNTYSGNWSKYEDAQIANWALKFLLQHKGYSVLDLGCGTGLVLDTICKDIVTENYHGVDISRQMLHLARSRATTLLDENAIELSHNNAISELQVLPKNSVDIIFALNGSASYIGNTRELINLSNEVLKNGGWLFLSYLNRMSLRRILSMKCGKVREYNSSRGVKNKRKLGVKVAAVDVEMLKARIPRTLEIVDIMHQGILSGVWEHELLIPVNNSMMQIFPQIGHTINLAIKKV